MNGIPEKLNDYNLYNDAEKLVGVEAECELPSFEAITTKISGPGILGEVESPNVGHFGSMKIAINFRTVSPDSGKLFEPRSQMITLRGDQGSYDVSKGVVEHQKLKVIVRGLPVKFEPGKVKPGESTGTKLELETYYIKIECDGNTLVELDKLNSIFIVNGTDYLADVRDNI
jgi:P2 family phage contractile tail tube protein